MSGNKMEDPANADVQPGANYHPVGLTARNGTSKLYYIPADATLALDQSISPQWSSAHTFLAGVNLGAGSAASLAAQPGVSLKYTVGSGVHAFYVGEKAVGQIDDPTNPAGDTSLVSKSYVDSHGGSGDSVQPGKPMHPGVSIGNAVTDGAAATYMRSDVVLQLDQSISPRWSAAHTFLSNINFGALGSSSLGQNGASLKYAVGNGQTHGFYVGGALVGVVDNPSSPNEDSSLVSKAYVDNQVVPVTFQKDIAISSLPLGIDDAPATTGSSHGSLAIGRNAAATADGGVALGDSASVSAAAGIAIGNLAVSTGSNSIAFGNFSVDGGQANVLSIGASGGSGTLRRIINMADGQDDTDAATVGQLKKLNVGSSEYVAFSSTNMATTAAATAASNDSMAIGMGAGVTGSYSLALGKQISVSADEGVAIGYATFCSGFQSVALGSYSGDQGQGNVVSVGWSAMGSPAVQRRIINVSDAKASNEAATLGQLQAYTSPRLSGYFGGGFSNLPDGLQGPQISALENWPIASAGILKCGTDATSVAKLTNHAATGALTFCICLNGAKIGSISFAPGQQVGAISFDKNAQQTDGNWPLQVGDLVSLTNPHPSVSGAEQASGLLVVIVSSVNWTCTAT